MMQKKWTYSLIPAALVALVLIVAGLPGGPPASGDAPSVLDVGTVLPQLPAPVPTPRAGANCPATNTALCQLSDYICFGGTCCCVYAGYDCPSHDRSIGPCFPQSPF